MILMKSWRQCIILFMLHHHPVTFHLMWFYFKCETTSARIVEQLQCFWCSITLLQLLRFGAFASENNLADKQLLSFLFQKNLNQLPNSQCSTPFKNVLLPQEKLPSHIVIPFPIHMALCFVCTNIQYGLKNSTIFFFFPLYQPKRR